MKIAGITMATLWVAVAAYIVVLPMAMGSSYAVWLVLGLPAAYGIGGGWDAYYGELGRDWGGGVVANALLAWFAYGWLAAIAAFVINARMPAIRAATRRWRAERAAKAERRRVEREIMDEEINKRLGK